MARNGTPLAGGATAPANRAAAEEILLRLGSIATDEQITCQMLQLELIAAIGVTSPGANIQLRAEAVLAVLAEAERAYNELLTELARAVRSSTPRRRSTLPRIPEIAHPLPASASS